MLQAATPAAAPACLTVSPAQGQERVWLNNPQQAGVTLLSAEQCAVAARQASSDSCWEYTKVPLLIVGGLVTTAVAGVAMLAVAGMILELTGELYFGLLFATNWLFASEIANTALSVVCLTGITFEVYSMMAGMFAVIALIWAKEFVPAIGRACTYGGTLSAQGQQFELWAAGDGRP